MKIARLLPLIGILVFLYILSGMKLQVLWEGMQKTNIVLLAASVLLIVPIVLIKAAKWKVLVGPFTRYRLSDSAAAWMVGFFAGMITPGRIGDISRALYLRKSVPFGKALTTVIVDRILDIIILFCLAITGIMILNMSVGVLPIIVALFAAFLAAIALSTRRGFVKSILKPLFSRFMPEKYRNNMSSIFRDFYSGLMVLKARKKRLAASVALSLIGWLLVIFQYQVLANALGLSIPYHFLFAIIPVTILIDILPISFSSIGTRDAAMIFFFSLLGFQAESAILFSLFILIINYSLLGLAGLVIWLRNPAKLKLE
jgi:uncharacterized protein (TIRG00374 family)